MESFSFNKLIYKLSKEMELNTGVMEMNLEITGITGG